MNMTTAELNAVLAGLPEGHPARKGTNVQAPRTERPKSREPRPSDGYRSKLERDYASRLEFQRRGGQIQWWAHEPQRLRLAGGAYYKPDFAVLMPDGRLELHEVKGFWREAARVRIKVAAEMHPFMFVAATRDRGDWVFEYFHDCFYRVTAVAPVAGTEGT
jgi:hypothetical protein